MMSSRNINVGVHPAVSLKDCVLETFLFVLMTSLRHQQLNNNLTTAVTCILVMQYRPNSRSERCKYVFTFICFVYLFVCKIVALH